MALVAIALCCGGEPAKGQPAAVDFSEELVAESRTATSSDGTVSLTWDPNPEPVTIELQQDLSREFADPMVRYRGTDAGSVLTGLPEGVHYFRVRAVDANGIPGTWSPPFELTVDYMNRGTLLAFLAVGGLVVALTAGAILKGHRNTRDEK